MTAVVGRDRVLAEIASFLDVADTTPRVLLIEGEAGIGKTTLWRAGVEAAASASYRIVAASPAEKEATFAYSVVGDLLEHVLGEVIAELPVPQRRGLEVALLLRESKGPPPEQHTLGVAFLAALRALAASQPVLLALDDIQWLDPSSAAMLQFAARRLRDERVVLLLARRRMPGMDMARLELALPEDRRLTLRVGPLSMGALHRMLRERLGATLARPALRRVHEASGGNPFYAVELVRALQSSGGRIRPGRPLPVPETLEAILRERIGALPGSVRETLAKAAALRRPTESMLGDWPALEQAVEEGLIEITNGEVRFTHPLLAAAAYGSIPASERHRLHRNLAGVTSDSEEQARHMALGARQPSNRVADALDDAHVSGCAGSRKRPRSLQSSRFDSPRRSSAAGCSSAGSRWPGYHLPAGEARHVCLHLSGTSSASCPPGPCERTRCCCSRAPNRASRGASGWRWVFWLMLVVTTPALRRSSAASVSCCSYRAPPSWLSSTPGRRWCPPSKQAIRPFSLLPSRQSCGSRR